MLEEAQKVLFCNLIYSHSKSVLGKDIYCIFKKIYEEDRIIYTVHIDCSNEFYVLKIRGDKAHKKEDIKSDATIIEYNKLIKANQIVEKMPKGYSMSKPIAMIETQKAIILTGCKGINFKVYYLKYFFFWYFFRKQLQNRLVLCGRWLSSYHYGSVREEPCAKYNQNRIEHLKRMVYTINNNMPKVGKYIKSEQLLDSFKYLFYENKYISIGLLHGNYAYRNILIDGKSINLIDFEDSREDSIYFDVGQFIAETIFKGSYYLLRQSVVDKQVASFIFAYNEKIIINKGLISAYTAYHMVAFLYEYSNRKSSNRIINRVNTTRIKYLSKWLNEWQKDPIKKVLPKKLVEPLNNSV